MICRIFLAWEHCQSSRSVPYPDTIHRAGTRDEPRLCPQPSCCLPLRRRRIGPTVHGRISISSRLPKYVQISFLELELTARNTLWPVWFVLGEGAQIASDGVAQDQINTASACSGCIVVSLVSVDAGIAPSALATHFVAFCTTRMICGFRLSLRILLCAFSTLHFAHRPCESRSLSPSATPRSGRTSETFLPIVEIGRSAEQTLCDHASLASSTVAALVMTIDIG